MLQNHKYLTLHGRNKMAMYLEIKVFTYDEIDKVNALLKEHQTKAGIKFMKHRIIVSITR